MIWSPRMALLIVALVSGVVGTLPEAQLAASVHEKFPAGVGSHEPDEGKVMFKVYWPRLA